MNTYAWQEANRDTSRTAISELTNKDSVTNLFANANKAPIAPDPTTGTQPTATTDQHTGTLAHGTETINNCSVKIRDIRNPTAATTTETSQLPQALASPVEGTTGIGSVLDVKTI